jgi:ribonuclease P protein subunit RPR2
MPKRGEGDVRARKGNVRARKGNVRARKGNVRAVAKERIKVLFERAEKEFSKHPDLSNRYVNLARKLSMKANVQIPPELKRKFCKKCLSYLKPGANLKVRLHRSSLIYTCGNCGNIMRFKKRKEGFNNKKDPGKNI